MELQYESKDNNLIFRHWLNYTLLLKDDNFFHFLAINDWVGGQFGELGIVWGYHRGLINNSNRLLNQVSYSWRFRHQADAMLFKLKFG